MKRKIAVMAILVIILGSFLNYELFFHKDNQFVSYKKKDTSSLLKIGFLTDWEYGTRKQLGHKLTRQAPVQLAKAVMYLNQEFHPDLVVGGGDYIESSTVKPIDAKFQMKEINDVFSLVQAPRLYVLGNHDLRSLSKDEVREVLGMAENHSIRDVGDWRIIVLDTNFDAKNAPRAVKNYVTGGVSQEELRWLEESLKTDRPVIVFSHHSPIPGKNIDGVFVMNITDAKEVRDILENAGNVAAVVSGHNPSSYFEKLNGINYLISDTLVNSFSLGSFATLDVSYDSGNKYAKIFFKQLGANKIEYQAEWKYGEANQHQKPVGEGAVAVATED